MEQEQYSAASCNQKLISLRQHADSLDATRIASLILDDPRFVVWSGSSRPEQHHYGTGGLITHTYEVVQLCMSVVASLKMIRSVGKRLDRSAIDEYTRDDLSIKAIFLAALMHDWGKLWDYEPESEPIQQDTKWRATKHKRLIHHISRSAIEWSRAAPITGCGDIEEEVTHAILSHHGQRSWGSPVAPRTKLAWLLHLCDGISARMNDCHKIDYYLSQIDA